MWYSPAQPSEGVVAMHFSTKSLLLKLLVGCAAAFVGPAAYGLEVCDNAVDDDGDFLQDCDDVDCGIDPTCCGGIADGDGDGWCDELDVCVLVADPEQVDGDADGTGNACDVCPAKVGDGLGGFGPGHVVITEGDGATSVYATDLDGDGDSDVLCASSLDDEVAWIENLGGGAFGAREVLTTTGDYPLSIYATPTDPTDPPGTIRQLDQPANEGCGCGSAPASGAGWPAFVAALVLVSRRWRR